MLVRDVLKEIGMDTTKTSKGFPVDLVGSGFAFEVTGLSRAITVSSEKYNQTLRFLEDHSKGEKVILVANTFKNFDPLSRPSPSFSKVVSESLKSHRVGLITTLNLYRIWKAVTEGRLPKEDAVKLLKDTEAEMQFEV